MAPSMHDFTKTFSSTPASALRRAVRSAPYLSVEEEEALWARLHRGDERARDVLVRAHLRLVIAKTKDLRHFIPRGGLDDLIQAGLIGLSEAIARFEPGHGARLATFAVWWILNTMRKHVREHMNETTFSGVRKAHKALFKIRARISQLERATPQADRSEILARFAEEEGLTLEDAEAMAAFLLPTPSLNELRNVPGMDQPCEWHETFVAEEAEEVDFDQALWSKALAEALARLPERERTVLSLRLLDPERSPSLREVGPVVGLKHTRLHEVERGALAMLRRHLLSSHGTAVAARFDHALTPEERAACACPQATETNAYGDLSTESKRRLAAAWLDAPEGETDEALDAAAVFDLFQERAFGPLLRAAMDVLDDGQRRVLSVRYLGPRPRPFDLCARSLGLSEAEIRRIDRSLRADLRGRLLFDPGVHARTEGGDEAPVSDPLRTGESA